MQSASSELRVMELLQEHIVRYTAFRGSLRECMFEDFDIASDERVVAAYNARMFAIRVIRFVQGEIPWVYLFNRLIAQRRAVLFTTAPELLAMIRDGFDGGQAENLIGLCQRVPFDPAQDRPWLVVDDLGAERLTDWAAEVLFRVFNARYTTRAHTLLVSNVQPDDIPEPRLRSRFLDGDLCQVVPNGAGDYRQRKSGSRMAQ